MKSAMDTELCACGSGLRRVRCCGLDPASLPDQAALALLDESGTAATKLFNEKKIEEAEALALKLLDLAPNHRMPLRVLFEIRKAQTKMPAAEALARRLASLPAASASVKAAANLQLAQLIIGQGRYEDAEAAARAAVIASPRDATIQHVMGVVLTETGKVRAGEAHYRKAVALLGRDDGMVLANIAWTLKLQGRLEEAAAIYEKALALRPDNSRGIGGFAQVEMARGRKEHAISLLDGGLARWPEDRTLRLLRAMADLIVGDAQAVLNRLSEPVEKLLPAELSVRGQALDRLNQPMEAVQAYALAKRLQRERYGQNYTPAATIEKAERYKAYFTAERLAAIPRAAAQPGPQPVFLLGFPRSGASLLEDLLTQIPGFRNGSDGPPLDDLIGLVPRLAGTDAAYPEALDYCLTGEGLDVPARLRERYLAGRGDGAFITDRTPGNVWHLGLIKLMFPEAPVIHLLRHPLDVVLSNLSQDKKLEANCNVSMVALARHYDLTMSLIRHYRGQLTLRYLPVRYEDLANNPAAALVRIIEFIGAKPGPAPLVPREPVHRRGLFRHKAYQAVLPDLFKEVLPIVQPWIDELGYGGVT
jgi:tetratricopeptide (TPR) repeat protein